MGWESTGAVDRHGDEVLELHPQQIRIREGEA
jgi:hypothetical protein